MNSISSPIFSALEAENVRLRAELAECRSHLVASLTVLGTAGALAEFPPDGTIEEIRAAITAASIVTYHRGFDAGVRHAEQGQI